MIAVRGGVLGDAHQSLLYALFCRRETPLVIERDGGFIEVLEYQAIWRGLLEDLGLKPHPNLVPRYLAALQDLQRVQLREMTVSADGDYLQPSPPLIDEITYEGASLHHSVTVRLGSTVAKTVRDRHLMSLDMRIYNRLRTPLARALWPIINGGSEMSFFCEQDLAPFLGFSMDLASRRQWEAFRRTCDRAFEDLCEVGALRSVRTEETAGRCGLRRLRRYCFEQDWEKSQKT